MHARPTLSLSLSLFGIGLLAGTPARAADTHEVKAPASQAVVGAAGTASLTIEGKNGWHLNKDFPIGLKLVAPVGVTLDKPKQTKKDLKEHTDQRARFDVGFTAAAAGKQSVEAVASFAVCQDSACKPVQEKVTLALDVTAPAAPVEKPAPTRPARKPVRVK
jgi:hypothetical protein